MRTSLTYEEQLDLLVQKSEGVSEYSWEELVDILGLDISSTTLRKSWNNLFGGYSVMKYLEDKDIASLPDDLYKLKDEVQKERMKMQRLNRERLEILRSVSDKELFNDLIINAVEGLKPIEIVKAVPSTHRDGEQTEIVFVADAHYGKSFELQGLFGEVVNHYSPDVFKARMWKLLSDLEKSRDEVDFDRLKIIDVGDCIDGILRTGVSLRKLQVGVMDSVLQYAEFMAIWICECYNRLKIPVEYSLTGGNHDLVRLLSSKKDFDDENIAKLIHEFVSLRIEISKLKNNPNVPITVKPYNDAIYHNIYGVNLMSYHGDSKNMKEDIEFFENFYNIQIDILVAGHLHRNGSEDIGIGDLGDRTIMRVPSICGTDDFAKSIRKSARPSAKVMVFNENQGLTWERKFPLG